VTTRGCSPVVLEV